MNWEKVAATMRYNDERDLPLYLHLSDAEMDALDLAGKAIDIELELISGWECAG